MHVKISLMCHFGCTYKSYRLYLNARWQIVKLGQIQMSGMILRKVPSPFMTFSCLTFVSLNTLQLHCVVPVLHGVQSRVRPHAGQACWLLFTLKNQTRISLTSWMKRISTPGPQSQAVRNISSPSQSHSFPARLGVIRTVFSTHFVTTAFWLLAYTTPMTGILGLTVNTRHSHYTLSTSYHLQAQSWTGQHSRHVLAWPATPWEFIHNQLTWHRLYRD
jgi:hypothetical protein